MAWKYSEQREAGVYSFWFGVAAGSLITALLAQYLGIQWAGVLGVGGGLFVLVIMKFRDKRRQRREKERRFLR
ncbi:MAG: hypothetical protein ACOY9Y_13700 [Bacillota bacterium]